MRLILIALAALLLGATTAAAQVAAPLVNPVPVFTSAPGNPATQSWDMPSRIGASVGRFDFEVPPAPNLKGDSKLAQAQYVGERFAFGALAGQLKGDDGAGNSIKIDFSAVGAAVQFGQWISLGIAQESNKQDFGGGGGGVEKETLPLGGVTVRLADVLFLGAAGGTATVDKGGNSMDRGVIRYGLGYRWQDKSGAFHLEAFKEHRDGVATPTNVDEEATAGFTLEARIGWFLIGYNSVDTDVTPGSGGPTVNRKLKTTSLGYVPEQGLSIVAASTEQESTPGAGPSKGRITSIGVAWLF
jgi:hypothetical protein